MKDRETATLGDNGEVGGTGARPLLYPCYSTAPSSHHHRLNNGMMERITARNTTPAPRNRPIITARLPESARNTAKISQKIADSGQKYRPNNGMMERNTAKNQRIGANLRQKYRPNDGMRPPRPPEISRISPEISRFGAKITQKPPKNTILKLMSGAVMSEKC